MKNRIFCFLSLFLVLCFTDSYAVKKGKVKVNALNHNLPASELNSTYCMAESCIAAPNFPCWQYQMKLSTDAKYPKQVLGNLTSIGWNAGSHRGLFSNCYLNLEISADNKYTVSGLCGGEFKGIINANKIEIVTINGQPGNSWEPMVNTVWTTSSCKS